MGPEQGTPSAFDAAINRLETRGYRLVRLVPTPPEHGGGATAFMSRRTRLGLRLAQVEQDGAGRVTVHD